jgi:DNA-binding transcriptional MerR regulator
MQTEARWRLEELAEQVRAALAAAPYDGQASARIRDVPDGRTIRYYTTLGILDRPAEMRGRTAYYGRRHLLQLVAIKRLQAQGSSLVDIQAKLTSASNRQLERLTGLPADYWQAQPGEGRSSNRRSKAFWAARPAPGAKAGRARRDAARKGAIPAVVLPLAPDVTLTLTDRAAAEFNAQRLAALQPIVEQLLAELHRRDSDK